MLANAAELPQAARRPEHFVDAQQRLARTVYDLVAEPLREFPVPVIEEAADLVRHIVAAMAGRFGAPEDEALVRVLAFFEGWDLTDDSEVGTLAFIGHQSPDEWAGSIYFGLDFHEVRPGMDPSALTPGPMPDWSPPGR
ncbi:hypothetical protein [Streptomyces sp. SP18CS02]|uniref:hypothetical protein n=1 Tax=Streptomyces sp. SP18CS02 TaxID=3002531 RepID=UPI002E776783|nr:hypothetical protein [Streptomyces sp. SP18CS02]MEE1753047.1 hypothetical protein [Streptomyces sp. SP18CS02]